MTLSKPLGIVLLLAALAAAVFWLVPRDQRSSPLSVDEPVTREAAGPGVGASSSRPGPEVSGRAPVAEPLPLGELAGRVVDDEGHPVATAAVRVLEHTAELEAALAKAGRRAGMGAIAMDQSVAHPVAADGTFRLKAPSAVNALTVVVTAKGHVDTRRKVEPIAARRVDLGDVTLVRGIVVRGRVVDSSGQGLAASAVRRRFLDQSRKPGVIDLEGVRDLNSREDRIERTDAAGRFELLLDKVGTFELTATHDEHPEVQVEIEARAPGEAIDNVELRMPPGVVVAGRVVGAPAGAALRVTAARKQKRQRPGLLAAIGALDIVPGSSARTADVSADGRFELRGLGAEVAYVLTVVERDGTLGGPPGGPCSDPTDVTAPAQGVELRYKAALVLTLRVVDATTQVPLARAHLDAAFTRTTTLLGMTSTMRTVAIQRDCDAIDGCITLRMRPGPKDARLSLAVLAAGYHTHEHEPVDVVGETKVDLGTIALTPAPILRVRVLASGTKAPLSGATVELIAKATQASSDRGEVDREFNRPFVAFAGDEGTDLERIAITKTDADGRCDLTVGRAGGVELRAVAADHAPARVALTTLPQSGTVAQELVLNGGGTITVVVRAGDRPVPGARVERRCGADVESAAGNQEGRTTFAHLPAGTHRFRVLEKEPGLEAIAGLEPHAADLQSVELAEGETRELVIVQPVRVAVYGTVTKGATPVAGAAVALVPVSDDKERIVRDLAGHIGATLFGARPERTDRHGRYRLERVALGEYRLRVTVPDQPVPTLVPVTVAVGDTRCDVVIASATLAGIVVDVAGNGIAGARVRVTGGDSGPELDEVVAGLIGTSATTASVTTDGQGRFEFEHVPAGVPLVVTAQSRTHCPASGAPVTLAPDQVERGVRIVLEPGGDLRVRVEGAGLDVVIAERIGTGAGKTKEVRTAFARDHIAELQALAPGRWQVRAAKDKAGTGAGAGTEVEVVAGKTAEVTIGR